MLWSLIPLQPQRQHCSGLGEKENQMWKNQGRTAGPSAEANPPSDNFETNLSLYILLSPEHGFLLLIFCSKKYLWMLRNLHIIASTMFWLAYLLAYFTCKSTRYFFLAVASFPRWLQRLLKEAVVKSAAWTEAQLLRCGLSTSGQRLTLQSTCPRASRVRPPTLHEQEKSNLIRVCIQPRST